MKMISNSSRKWRSWRRKNSRRGRTWTLSWREKTDTSRGSTGNSSPWPSRTRPNACIASKFIRKTLNGWVRRGRKWPKQSSWRPRYERAERQRTERWRSNSSTKLDKILASDLRGEPEPYTLACRNVPVGKRVFVKSLLLQDEGNVLLT